VNSEGLSLSKSIGRRRHRHGRLGVCRIGETLEDHTVVNVRLRERAANAAVHSDYAARAARESETRIAQLDDQSRRSWIQVLDSERLNLEDSRGARARAVGLADGDGEAEAGNDGRVDDRPIVGSLSPVPLSVMMDDPFCRSNISAAFCRRNNNERDSNSKHCGPFQV